MKEVDAVERTSNNLDEFLSLDKVENITKEIRIRIGNKTLPLTIKAMGSTEFKECNNIARMDRVNSKGEMRFDSDKFNLAVMERQIIKPNFNDAEFLEKAMGRGRTAADYFRAYFPVGVITEIVSQITTLSGFDTEIPDLVEEAKK